MKDIAGQDIHLGDRVAFFSPNTSAVTIGRVSDVLAVTNKVEIDVESVSINWQAPQPPDHRYRQIQAPRQRVAVLR